MEPSVQLAQKLAANDKKSRDRALRKLRRYLSARSADPEGGFTADEFCKIWKGLFYCMWMQDKPLIQEELALTMSQLVHALQTRPSQNLFFRTFWQTLSREWNGIDRLRLDKFYTLSRLVLRRSVELLKKGDWEESLLEEFLSILLEEVLKAADVPLGVQLHLIDIYLDEVAKVGSSELSADMNLKLIDPFCKIAATSKNGLLQQSVVSGIFQTILDQSPFAIEDLMKEVGHTPADGDNCSDSGEPPTEDCEDIGPVLQFDYQALADRLFNLVNRKNIPNRNRKNLYWLVKRFKDLAEGIFPQDDIPEDVSTDEDDDEFSSWRFRKRQKRAQERLAREKMELSSQGESTMVEKRGKQKRAAENPPEPPAAKKKRKNKRGATTGREDQSKVNGVTHDHPSIKVTGDTQSPPELEPSQSSMAARLKRRRRGGLLKLGLSVLPLRGAMMMRRRRVIRERRKISSKASPIGSADVMTSPETPAPQHTTSTPKRTAPALQGSAPAPKCTAPAPQSTAPAPKRTASAPKRTTPALQGSAPARQDFVTFQKPDLPKPLYVKGLKSKGHPAAAHVNCKSKKVTFSLNKNMTAEFKRTDRSLLVSPTGSSRVPFNPNQQPQHGVLKTPTPPKNRGPRAKAADFF